MESQSQRQLLKLELRGLVADGLVHLGVLAPAAEAAVEQFDAQAIDEGTPLSGGVDGGDKEGEGS